MKKIAEDVTVCVKQHFDKRRPFPIINGVMSTKPVFIPPGAPNVMEYAKPLFVEGDEYRIGVYYGEVYYEEGKNYSLFRITKTPSKILSVPTGSKSSQMMLLISSPGGTQNMIYVPREGTVEADMGSLQRKIKSMCASMPELRDCASDEVEVYVRNHYLMEKLDAVGGVAPGQRRRTTRRGGYRKYLPEVKGN